MTLEEKLFRLISRRREEPKVEFKETLDLSTSRNQAEFAKLVIAIANTKGWDGYIIIGVKDKRNCPSELPQDYIVGFSVTDPDQLERRMNQVINEYCQPLCPIRYEELTYPDPQKKFGVVIIPRSSNRPHLPKQQRPGTQEGVTYIRRGAMVVHANPDEIRQMIKQDEKAVTVINFAHPFKETPEQIEQIIGCRIEEFIDCPTPKLELQEGFEAQIDKLIDEVLLTSEDWQTRPLIINIPTYHLAAVVIIAKLHGRMGHFPSIFYVIPEREGDITSYPIKRIIDLQALRDQARSLR